MCKRWRRFDRRQQLVELLVARHLDQDAQRGRASRRAPESTRVLLVHLGNASELEQHQRRKAREHSLQCVARSHVWQRLTQRREQVDEGFVLDLARYHFFGLGVLSGRELLARPPRCAR